MPIIPGNRQSTSHMAETATALATSTVALLLPALINGFPLVFPDTGAYLAVAWDRRWGFDRSGFYGLAMKPLSAVAAPVQLWAFAALQALALAAILMLCVRAIWPERSARDQFLIICAIALLTSCSWHASQLMPDAFTGACLLVSWLSTLRRPNSPGTPLLWMATIATGLMHYTHIILVTAALIAALLTQALVGLRFRDLIPRAAMAAIAVAAIVGIQIAANGYFLTRWVVAPAGPAFIFARLNEDGFIRPWMSSHCSDVPELCAIYNNLPQDSQSLLWDRSSPFSHLIWDQSNSDSSERLLSQMKTASVGSIGARPIAFFRSAVSAGGLQAAHFSAVDDECPRICSNPSSAVYDSIERYRPEALSAFRNSAQFRGKLPKTLVRIVTTPFALVGIFMLVGAAVVARRRMDSEAFSLAIVVLVGLIVNAAATGALSDVHARYQSRIVWLAPFAATIIVGRLWSARATDRVSGGLEKVAPRLANTGPR